MILLRIVTFRSFLPLLLLAALVATSTQASSFDPYELNGGLVSAVAGKDFSIVAADTRMIGSGGYLLASRNHISTRLWSVDDESSTMIQELEEELRSSHPDDQVVSPKTTIQTITRRQKAPIMIGAAGCSADCAALQRVVRADLRAASYFGQMSSAITSPQPDQVATLLSQILYLRRSFPYYSFCVLSGMSDPANGGDGCGQVYVYDAIGSYEQVAVATSGTGREALQPILDRLFACTQQRIVQGTADQAIQTLCEAYRSVSEREIGVGDNLVLHVTERRGQEVDCRVVVLPLKQH